jgi:hypothetical protein
MVQTVPANPAPGPHSLPCRPAQHLSASVSTPVPLWQGPVALRARRAFPPTPSYAVDSAAIRMGPVRRVRPRIALLYLFVPCTRLVRICICICTPLCTCICTPLSGLVSALLYQALYLHSSPHRVSEHLPATALLRKRPSLGQAARHPRHVHHPAAVRHALTRTTQVADTAQGPYQLAAMVRPVADLFPSRGEARDYHSPWHPRALASFASPAIRV